VAPCVSLRPPRQLPLVVRPASRRRGPTDVAGLRAGVAAQSPLRANRGKAGAGVRVVPCDSVGTTYLLPAAVYRWHSRHVLDGKSSGGSGVGPPISSSRGGGQARLVVRHYAHALTEHFPVVHAAKYLLEVEVLAVPGVVVMHADLPMFGEVRQRRPRRTMQTNKKESQTRRETTFCCIAAMPLYRVLTQPLELFLIQRPRPASASALGSRKGLPRPGL
jgi:hypothetical protein